MEERWWFVFENRYDRIKFLWLEFMAIEDDKHIDETTPIFEEKEENTKTEFSYEDHQYLTWSTWNLFVNLKERIMKLNPRIKEEIKKLYIAFKYNTNFVDIVPQRQWLRLSLNMEFDEINDPRWMCEDVRDLWRWWNWDISIHFNNPDDIDYVMWLIKQSFDKQKKDGWSLFDL